MKNWQTGLIRLWEKYKYFIAVILLGAVLLVTAQSPDKRKQVQETDSAQQSDFDLAEFQRDIEESLSAIEGAGRVRVLLSLEAGEESVYATEVNRSSQTTGGGTDSESESFQSAVSVLSDGTYGEAPVLIKSKYPTFRGAVILCDGADSDAVRLQIIRAVSALCGITSDHISISKMSQ